MAIFFDTILMQGGECQNDRVPTNVVCYQYKGKCHESWRCSNENVANQLVVVLGRGLDSSSKSHLREAWIVFLVFNMM